MKQVCCFIIARHRIFASANLGIFQKLVLSSAFTGEYRDAVRKRILEYYRDHVQGEDLDACLEMMDYREYAMVDKKILLEILIQRGLFPQAMSVVEAFGFEGVEECELLKLASRMIIRCDCAEDEELIALASHVYRNGIYDEVILQYLMKFRFGPVEELLDIWKSACGFEMDTYEPGGKDTFASDVHCRLPGRRRKDPEILYQSFRKGTGDRSLPDTDGLWNVCKGDAGDSVSQRISQNLQTERMADRQNL